MYRGVGIVSFVIMLPAAALSFYQFVVNAPTMAHRLVGILTSGVNMLLLWFIGASLGWW